MHYVSIFIRKYVYLYRSVLLNCRLREAILLKGIVSNHVKTVVLWVFERKLSF